MEHLKENMVIPMDEVEDKKITRTDALARVKDGEELLFATCPCCQNLLAIYIDHKPPEVKPTNLN